MEEVGQEAGQSGAKEDYFEIDIPYNVFQTLRDGNYDLQNICRICLSNNNEVLYPILSASDDTLSHMFTAVTLLQPQPEDGLPQNICGVCQEQVGHCYEFKVKCERADYILKSVLTGQFVADDPIHRVIKDEDNNVNDTKIEDEVIEDIQYLEDIYTKDLKDTDANKQGKKKRTKPSKYCTDSDHEFNKTTEDKNIKRKYECSLCRRVFRKEETYHTHIETKHNKDIQTLPHPCKHCKWSFNSEHDLLIHSAIHITGAQEGMWRCNRCPKEFKSKLLLKRHLERHMQTKRHSCPQCDKTFTEKYAMIRHARVHTGQLVDKKYQCHLCDKRFGQSTQLSVHISRHSGVTSHSCNTCSKRFPSARLLASHRLVHTEHKRYQCSYCHKRFRHESTRTTHQRTHTGEKPYVCSVCGKRFIQNSNLTLHMRTHTGERPYSCTTCGRNFSSGSSLKAHERVHTGERPYGCEVCGKRFARGGLSVHMRTHTGERPFRCGACERSFTTRARLLVHCRVHTGEKPYECATCSKTFISKSHLIKHIKKHAIKNPPQVLRPANQSETSNEVTIEAKTKKKDYQCYFVKSLALSQVEKQVVITNPVALKIPLEKSINNTELIIVNGLQEGVDPSNVIIELHSK